MEAMYKEPKSTIQRYCSQLKPYQIHLCLVRIHNNKKKNNGKFQWKYRYIADIGRNQETKLRLLGMTNTMDIETEGV